MPPSLIRRNGLSVSTLSALSVASAVSVLFAVSAPPAAGQSRLGTIRFGNSGAPAAQAAFLRGTLLLHSFEYEDATRSFKEAQRIDPDFAMAYWGEALSYTHPVWNQQDLAAARAALARLAPTREARRAKAPTPREQAYLETMEILYGEGPKPHRDTLYAITMEQLVRAYPDDDEAKAFYALALLALGQGERDVWSYMRAAAVAQEVFERNPDHPGAAHYLIHSFDDPTHAPLGLKAARAYSRIAPDAAHAQHMTSHIFVALGLWNDVVAANEQAMQVTERQMGRAPVGCRHYNEWLEYGYLQQGRLKDAVRLVEECRVDVERRRGAAGSLEHMQAMYLADTTDWQRSMAAGALFDGPSGPSGLGDVLQRMRLAIELVAKQQPDAALVELRRAADLEERLPFEFGPPTTYKPPRELEGELLLRLNRPADAARAFHQALRRTPERAAALLGLARASAKAGDAGKAVATYRQLKAIWHRAEPGYGPLAEAEGYLAQHLSERP